MIMVFSLGKKSAPPKAGRVNRSRVEKAYAFSASSPSDSFFQRLHQLGCGSSASSAAGFVLSARFGSASSASSLGISGCRRFRLFLYSIFQFRLSGKLGLGVDQAGGSASASDP